MLGWSVPNEEKLFSTLYQLGSLRSLKALYPPKCLDFLLTLPELTRIMFDFIQLDEVMCNNDNFNKILNSHLTCAGIESIATRVHNIEHPIKLLHNYSNGIVINKINQHLRELHIPLTVAEATRLLPFFPNLNKIYLVAPLMAENLDQLINFIRTHKQLQVNVELLYIDHNFNEYPNVTRDKIFLDEDFYTAISHWQG